MTNLLNGITFKFISKSLHNIRSKGFKTKSFLPLLLFLDIDQHLLFNEGCWLVKFNF